MKRFADDTGVTLAELLVVIVLMGIMMAASYMILSAARMMSNTAIARSDSADQAQRFIDRGSREFREALEASESAGVFTEIGTRRTVFYSDVNHDTKPEKITYYVTGNTIYRTQASTLDSVTPFVNFSGASTPQPIVTALDPGWTGPLFVYYDYNNTAQTATSKIPTLSRVDLAIQTKATSGNRSYTTSMGISARIRAVQNDLGN
jgi:prepilin-type N-terminal cleavage/methylation domain-containing protein